MTTVLRVFAVVNNKCFCGDESTDLELYCSDDSCSNANCNEPCSGDSSETCGGTWSMSVYSRGGCSTRRKNGPKICYRFFV